MKEPLRYQIVLLRIQHNPHPCNVTSARPLVLQPHQNPSSAASLLLQEQWIPYSHDVVPSRHQDASFTPV